VNPWQWSARKNFIAGIIEVFREEYLRRPSQADVDGMLQVVKAHDFSDMLGNIKCIQ